jgi:hypothetical protein
MLRAASFQHSTGKQDYTMMQGSAAYRLGFGINAFDSEPRCCAWNVPSATQLLHAAFVPYEQ